MPRKSLLPFLILGLGFLWAHILERLRQRSIRRQETGDSAPASQRLAWIGMGGLLLFMIAAAVVAYVKWFQQPGQ